MGQIMMERLGRDAMCTRRTSDPTAGRRFALLALVTALAGCATVGPKFVEPPVAVNPQWTSKEAAQLDTSKAADAAWWRTFNDPVLDRLIDMAWHENLTLRAAGLRIAESRAQLAVAAGSKWPQIQALFAQANAVGLSNRGENVQHLETIIPDFDRTFKEFQAGFDVHWELDFWGRYRNMERAEAAHYVTTVADYDSALVTLSAEVARAYTTIRTNEALISLAEKNVKLQEDGFRIAQSRFSNGATSELDVAQARTLLESTKVSIPKYQFSLSQAQNALSTLLGQPVGKVQEMLGTTATIPVAPASVAVSMPAQLLRRRPDIRSAEFAALEQSSRVGIATADLYPRISLAGTIGVLTTGGGVSNAGYYTIGPSIWLPILNYGQTRNSIRIEDARLQELIVKYQDTVLRAQQEAEDGMTGFVKSHEAAEFAQNAATAAQRSSDISFVQYREGAIDFQRALDAMRSLLQEETALVQARSDTATNLISLYKALGGGWELQQNQPPIPESTRTEMEKRTNWSDLLSTPPSPETLNMQNGQEKHHE
jgi:NodT family efflux transporter outer membrane factor (OMF) lipoprotein